MPSITFVTGNPGKAEYLAKYLEFPVSHIRLELTEIQSLDLKEIVEHKLKQAYEQVKSPVLVEDGSLEFEALGNFPWPFIKYFLASMSCEDVCLLLDGKPRGATARCIFWYYDGEEIVFFEGTLNGEIAQTPAGENGFGWDPIFIPEGYNVTRSCLSEKDDRKTYLQMKPFDRLKEFLEGKNF